MKKNIFIVLIILLTNLKIGAQNQECLTFTAARLYHVVKSKK